MMKLLVQGAGYIGEVHLTSITKYKLCEVALCEMNEERLRIVAEKYQITETYTSLEEALLHPFDGVIICTPNFAHKGGLERCIRAGLNVMLEKPMAESLESAEQMYQLCREHNRFAFVAYCLRFAAPYRRIKAMIEEGKLGQVFSIRASVAGKKAISDAKTNYRTIRSQGGGVISDFSHEIDYALWFAGAPVREVKCIGNQAVHKDWDVLDTAELLIDCENNITLSIHMDFLQPYFGRTIEIYGTNGAIRWRDNECIKFYDIASDTWIDMESAINWEHVYRDEIIHYLDCLTHNKRPLVDEESGYKTYQVIAACTKSAEEHIF